MLLLENNPLHCDCGGIAVATNFLGGWLCQCDACGTEGWGDTSADAEIHFQIERDKKPSVLDQALDRGCLQGFDGNVVVCAVEDAAHDYPLSAFLRDQPRLGCILVDTSTEEDWMAYRNREYCSLVLFHPRWWLDAWSIARRIRHSHRGLAALVKSDELFGGIYITLSRHHSLVLDGQQIFGAGGDE